MQRQESRYSGCKLISISTMSASFFFFFFKKWKDLKSVVSGTWSWKGEGNVKDLEILSSPFPDCLPLLYVRSYFPYFAEKSIHEGFMGTALFLFNSDESTVIQGYPVIPSHYFLVAELYRKQVTFNEVRRAGLLPIDIIRIILTQPFRDSFAKYEEFL